MSETGQVVRIGGDEIAVAEHAETADLERGDGFGRVDSEALQPYGMAECPLGLAFAQASVYQPVEQSQVP